MKKWKVGIAGIGFIGLAHIEALRRLGNVDIVAVASSSMTREKADRLHIENFYTSYVDLLEQEPLDAIHICTPNDTHFPIAKAAMEKGVHVFCEKPFTVTIEEAQELTNLAASTNVVNCINFQNRFYPIIAEMRQMVKEGSLGRIFSIHGAYLQDWLLYDTDFNWRLLAAKGGKTRTMGDIGSHWMDLVEFITGNKIQSLIADFGQFYPLRKAASVKETFSQSQGEDVTYQEVAIDTEDFVSVMMRFDNGAMGNVVLSQMFSGKKNKISVFIGGSEASLEWDSDSISNIVVGNRSKGNVVLTKDPNLLHPQAAKLASYPGGHVEGYPDAIKQVMKEFYSKIENPQATTEFATFADGLRQMQLAEKVYESAQSKAWVQVAE